MKRFTLVNLLLFQAAWFSAALAGQWAFAILTALLLLHMMLSPTRMQDLSLLPLALIGWSADMLLQAGNLVSFGSNVPLWLALLWCHLVLCLNHGLRWLNNLPVVLVSFIGALGGSSSYYAGVKLGTISTALPSPTFLAIYAALWSLLLPILLKLSTRANRLQGIQVMTGGTDG